MTHNTREQSKLTKLKVGDEWWISPEELHHQLQKAREEGKRAVWERIKRDANRDETGMYMFYLADHSELEQDITSSNPSV